MDPNTTLRDLIDAIEADDRDAAGWYVRDLAHWLTIGGFAPDWQGARAAESALNDANEVEAAWFLCGVLDVLQGEPRDVDLAADEHYGADYREGYAAVSAQEYPHAYVNRSDR